MRLRQAGLFERPGRPVAGVDEAGRGPLAGPVVAAAVVLDPARPIEGLDDSKRLSARRREGLALEIRSSALACGVAWADAAEIDRLNILVATMLAMRRALLCLRMPVEHVLVDGNRMPDLRFFGWRPDGEVIVGGDASVPAISAASILAKVERDRMMQRLDRVFPGYGFARHKGYGTAEHFAALARLGPCSQHRQSFEPCRRHAGGAATGPAVGSADRRRGRPAGC
ncbi:MAG: ribonuclease HII [Gammaproteobacteria bacterium]|nr:ribonuclease HII [Gammaproteobacteria bacterium]MDH4252933.1 ribonuclease HII [Gammaproteobacteria bacterium]MDH5308381.1 ribonuclease HII [Gammaproteobacteria bacterium]